MLKHLSLASNKWNIIANSVDQDEMLHNAANHQTAAFAIKMVIFSNQTKYFNHKRKPTPTSLFVWFDSLCPSQ